MTMNDCLEDFVVGQVFWAWLRAPGRCIVRRTDIVLGISAAGTTDHGDLVVAQWLFDALQAKLTPGRLRIETAEDSIERALA